MLTRATHNLTILDHVARALAETTSIQEVKSLRDKAEAARKYAQCAALGLRIQNYAAELKLRAERRAGELLAALIIRGGDRRSNSHDGSLKLADLGINYNQSSRWRREAAVPQPVFERYVELANQSGKDITAQGLMRLERRLAQGAQGSTERKCDSDNGNTTENGSASDRPFNGRGYNGPKPCPSVAGRHSDEEPLELLQEARDHRDLLARILQPLCDHQHAVLKSSERRMIARLLRELQSLMERMGQTLERAT